MSATDNLSPHQFTPGSVVIPKFGETRGRIATVVHQESVPTDKRGVPALPGHYRPIGAGDVAVRYGNPASYEKPHYDVLPHTWLNSTRSTR